MIDDVVGGYRIRRGTLIGISIYTLQRDPRWWVPDADSYEPMRFYGCEMQEHLFAGGEIAAHGGIVDPGAVGDPTNVTDATRSPGLASVRLL